MQSKLKKFFYKDSQHLYENIFQSAGNQFAITVQNKNEFAPSSAFDKDTLNKIYACIYSFAKESKTALAKYFPLFAKALAPYLRKSVKEL